MDHSSLSPAAAYVLIDLEGSRGSEALKVALAWLASKDVLQIESRERKGLLSKGGTFVVPGVAMQLPRHAHDLVHQVVRKERADGIPLDRFIELAKERYGRSLSGFKDEVRKDLVEAGLVEEVREKFLWVFTKTRFRRSPAGAAWQEEAVPTAQRLKEVPELLRTDPAKAAALIAAAGSLIFLLPELRPHFGALSAALQASGTSFSDGFGAFDPVSLAVLSSDAFDDLGSGLDDAGNDSGSDGDGGDGGGGGD